MLHGTRVAIPSFLVEVGFNRGHRTQAKPSNNEQQMWELVLKHTRSSIARTLSFILDSNLGFATMHSVFHFRDRLV